MDTGHPLAITVAMPCIPPRMLPNGIVHRALQSVGAQTLQPRAISMAIDTEREGAALTRQRALDNVRTPWTAFLDDDDAFMPQHLQRLAEAATDHDADYVYSWFEVIDVNGRKYGSYDPVFPPTHFSEPWDPANPRHTTMIVMVKTDLAKSVGFQPPEEENPRFGNEDWRFTVGCIEAGAKVHHVIERTWYWFHHSNNTSGLPDRW